MTFKMTLGEIVYMIWQKLPKNSVFRHRMIVSRYIMKKYNSLLEFVAGLIGVILHSLIAIFLLSYLAYPDMLLVMLDVSEGAEKQALLSFIEDVSHIHPIIYVGTAIVVVEWYALLQIRKYENKQTPVWSAYLILGSLYAYFYFGGLEVFLLLFFAGSLTLYKFFKHYKLSEFREEND